MAIEAFRACRFSEGSLQKIALCNDIIAEYLGQGLRLTLRQLYYQLVTRNAIRNEEREYKTLSRVVSDARLAGLMDWEAIEDRVRQPRRQTEFADLAELTDAALASYRLPRWRGQKDHVELWVEKDALAGVLQPLAREYHVTLMVNRGYSSQSAMYESASRFREAAETGKTLRLLYLGDHDPSGEDMVRDIEARLTMFGVAVSVVKLALTMDQVRRYNPPPNPAKVTDPRAKGYIAEHGESSWEVDALPPNVLARLIRAAFRKILNRGRWNEVLEREERDKTRLRAALRALNGEAGSEPELERLVRTGEAGEHL